MFRVILLTGKSRVNLVEFLCSGTLMLCGLRVSANCLNVPTTPGRSVIKMYNPDVAFPQVGSQVTIVCLPGWIRSGPDDVHTCTDQGITGQPQWVPEVPDCFNTTRCPVSGTPCAFGLDQSGGPLGGYCFEDTCVCYPGYHNASCNLIYNCKNPLDSAVLIKFRQGYFHPGDKANFECNDLLPNVVPADERSIGERICVANNGVVSIWVPVPVNCVVSEASVVVAFPLVLLFPGFLISK